jgi:arylsulfatase A-like enzyme
VPLIIRPPGGNSGFRAQGLARTVDILPTFIELLKLGCGPSDLDGISLATSIQSGAPASATEAVSVMNKNFVEVPRLPDKADALWNGFALTTERYKQIWEPLTNRRMAFDLRLDPKETIDISAQGIEALEEGWSRLRWELFHARVGALTPADVEEVNKRLRDLGYME